MDNLNRISQTFQVINGNGGIRKIFFFRTVSGSKTFLDFFFKQLNIFIGWNQQLLGSFEIPLVGGIDKLPSAIDAGVWLFVGCA
jgi:hypothetical protein